ncbi:MAG: cyanophycinase, partial [Xenococcus sp. (in: cyanobacteria)]
MNIKLVAIKFITFVSLLVIFLFTSLFLGTGLISTAFADAVYNYTLQCGTVNSISPQPSPVTMLIGGSEKNSVGEDAATEWFLRHAEGGDYLVLRYGEIGGQAKLICDDYDYLVSSAAELAINTREAANNPDVVQYIRDAEALFLAGGNQNNYQDTWRNTKVEYAINYLINDKKVPVAGTSAGMAIFGEYYYAPRSSGVLSSEILENPFHRYTEDIDHSDFIDIPFLKDTITDTHLDRGKTRYGRLFAFLARVVDDNGIPSYGIGLEGGAFVAIDENGIAKVFGNGEDRGADAYFLRAMENPEIIEPREPLVWNNNGRAVKVYIIQGTAEGSGSFPLNDWKNS